MLCNLPSKERWHRITNLPCNVRFRTTEEVFVWERLQSCSFPVRDRSIKLRVKITTLFRLEKLGSYGKGGFIPTQPPENISGTGLLTLPAIRRKVRPVPHQIKAVSAGGNTAISLQRLRRRVSADV